MILASDLAGRPNSRVRGRSMSVARGRQDVDSSNHDRDLCGGRRIGDRGGGRRCRSGRAVRQLVRRRDDPERRDDRRDLPMAEHPGPRPDPAPRRRLRLLGARTRRDAARYRGGQGPRGRRGRARRPDARWRPRARSGRGTRGAGPAPERNVPQGDRPGRRSAGPARFPDDARRRSRADLGRPADGPRRGRGAEDPGRPRRRSDRRHGRRPARPRKPGVGPRAKPGRRSSSGLGRGPQGPGPRALARTRRLRDVVEPRRTPSGSRRWWRRCRDGSLRGEAVIVPRSINRSAAACCGGRRTGRGPPGRRGP